MSKIVSLHGGEIKPPGEALPSVVELAEEVLEMAKSGEICGLFLVTHHSDRTYSRRMAGEANGATVGYLERLKHAICIHLDKE